MAKAFGVEQSATAVDPGRVRAARSSSASGSGGRIAQSAADTISNVTSALIAGAKDRRAGAHISSLNEALEGMRVSGKNTAERRVFMDQKVSDLTKKYGATYGSVIRDGVSLQKTRQVHNQNTNTFDILNEAGTIVGSRPDADLMDPEQLKMMEMAKVGGAIEGETPKIASALGSTIQVSAQSGKQFAGQSEMMKHMQSIADLPNSISQSTMRIQALHGDNSLSGEARASYVSHEYDTIMNTMNEGLSFYVRGKRAELLQDNKAPYDMTLVEHNIDAYKSEMHQLLTESGFLEGAQISKAESRSTLDAMGELYGNVAKMALEDKQFSIETASAIIMGGDLLDDIKKNGTGVAVAQATARITAYNEYEAAISGTAAAGPTTGRVAVLAANVFNSASALHVRKNMLTQNAAVLSSVDSLASLTAAYSTTTEFLKSTLLLPQEKPAYAAKFAQQWMAHFDTISGVVTHELGDEQGKLLMNKYKKEIEAMARPGAKVDVDRFTTIVESFGLPRKAF